MRRWSYIQVPLDSGFSEPSTGNFIPGRPGVTIPHWIDVDGAAANLRAARRLADQAKSFLNNSDLNDSAITDVDVAAWNTVQASFAAVANVYNGINTPWYLHPAARSLYREWISGPPAGINAAQIIRSIYAKNIPYDAGYQDRGFQDIWAGIADNRARLTFMRGRFGWWDSRLEMRLPTARTFGGKIPAQWKNKWDTLVGDASGGSIGMFVQLGGLRLDKSALGASASYSGDASQLARLPAEYAAEAINKIFPSTGYDRLTGSPGMPYSDGQFPQDAERPQRSYVGNNPPRETIRWGRFEPSGVITPNWRAFGVSANFAGGAVFIPPLYVYIQWLDSWISLLESSSPMSVVSESIQYGIHSNNQQAAVSGITMEDLIAESLGQPAAVVRAANQRDPSLAIASQVAAAAGAALGPFTFGIGTLVGGALSAIFSAVNLMERPPQNIHKDDLGRWKPILERTSLGGRMIPEGNTANIEQFMPTFDVPIPEGERIRTRITGFNSNIGINRINVTSPQSQSQAIQSSSGNLLLPILIVAGGTFLVYNYSKSK